jgi:uncharacterized membrane protein YdfJ with MMPL/SSD domain
VLERWTRTVLRFRVAVLALWLALLVVGVWSTTRLSPLLSNSFAVPGTDSDRARAILTRNFGERPDGTFTVVFRVRKPSDPRERRRAKRRLAETALVAPTGHPDSVRPGAGVLWADLDTNLDLRHAKRYTAAIRESLQAQRGPRAFVTGQPAIQHDLDSIFGSDLRRGESFALPIALLVLLAVLGLSLAAAVPFVFAACTITGTLAAVYAIAHALAMVTYVTNLVELIGLGLAIDYSLLVVHRFRDELAADRPVDEAIVRTIATAGRAIVFSGFAVAVGLGLLLFVPVPFIRSMGVAGLFLPLVSIVACLTFQPALLSVLGRRSVRRLRARRWAAGSRFWAGLARVVLRNPVPVLVGSATLLVLAAVPAAFLELTPGSITGIPRSLESVRGFELLRDRVGPGVVTPTHIVLDAGAPGKARRSSTSAAVDRLGDELARDPEAYVIASGPSPPYVDPTGRYARVIVVGRHEYGDPDTRRFVDRLRSRIVPAAKVPPGVGVFAGGAPAQGADFLTQSYDAFPWVVAGVLVLTFLILMRAFRSLVLPLKAVAVNVLSVAAVYGLLVVFFRWGLGAYLFGLPRRSELEGWIPIFLFAVLFGLSMDYEVFLVSRMRETWDETADNARAVADGLERTGRIITAAALIMCAAFLGFAAGRVVALQEFGVGLALAVLIDATIVRALLVPSAMALLGRWNWWLPQSAARLLRIH